MSGRRFTAGEEVKASSEMGYVPVDRAGSHVKLRYVHPETGDVRNVTVPVAGELRTGTLRSIAEQCGAGDFDAWREWIEELR